MSLSQNELSVLLAVNEAQKSFSNRSVSSLEIFRKLESYLEGETANKMTSANVATYLNRLAYRGSGYAVLNVEQKINPRTKRKANLYSINEIGEITLKFEKQVNELRKQKEAEILKRLTS